MTEPTPESIYDFARERGYMRETEPTPTAEERAQTLFDDLLVTIEQTGDDRAVIEIIQTALATAEARGAQRERERWEHWKADIVPKVADYARCLEILHHPDCARGIRAFLESIPT